MKYFYIPTLQCWERSNFIYQKALISYDELISSGDYSERRYLMGTDKNSDIVVEDKYVGKSQVEICFGVASKYCYVEGLGYGTWINGRKLKPGQRMTIKDDDRLNFDICCTNEYTVKWAWFLSPDADFAPNTKAVLEEDFSEGMVSLFGGDAASGSTVDASSSKEDFSEALITLFGGIVEDVVQDPPSNKVEL